MAYPSNLGPLGLVFSTLRALQLAGLCAIVGLAVHLIIEIVSYSRAVPDVIVGTLVVSGVTIFYVTITFFLFCKSALHLVASAAADSAVLIGIVIVATVVGIPASALNCHAMPTTGVAADILTSVATGAPRRTACDELRIVWGLALGLCGLFASSAVVLGFLWRRVAATMPPPVRALKRSPASWKEEDLEA